MPASKGDLEDRLEQLPEVVMARVEAVCCESGGVLLFAGIAERGAPHFTYHSPPGGEALLPEEIVETYQNYVSALASAAREGKVQEDLTHGHPLHPSAAVRALQTRFLAFAGERLPLLRDVLRNSANEEHRAIAATIVGYGPKKAEVIDDLQYAMQDPGEPVRANATRALEAIAVLARLQPALELRVSPTWFVEMLNSVIFSDRHRAAVALVTLTEENAASTLEQIRARAWDSVIEMARWKSLRHAVPAYILFGRMAGIPEKRIQESWSKGEREQTIAAVLKRSR
jgi:hypothetical protein